MKNYINWKTIQVESADTCPKGYHYIPTLLLFILAPVLGLLYIIFLPLAGFVGLTTLTHKKVTRTMKELWYSYHPDEL
jgi:hypothetical protein